MVLKSLLLIHICSATIGLLSGFLAMAMRKGSGRHGAAGTVFFVSMLSMSATGAYIAAFLRPNILNVIAALLTFYLVSTAWRAARNRAGGTNGFDLGALLLITAVGVLGLVSGFQAAGTPKGAKDGSPAAIYFIFGSVALLHALADIRMLKRGGVIGPRRIGRHLWRMSFALLIATLSFYPGQARLFSKALKETNLLFAPHILLIGSLIFWMYRVRVRKRALHSNVTVADRGDGVVANLAA